jgi:hypothetical protein
MTYPSWTGVAPQAVFEPGAEIVQKKQASRQVVLQRRLDGRVLASRTGTPPPAATRPPAHAPS